LTITRAILVPLLKGKGHEVIGYDSGYVSTNLLEVFDEDYTQTTKDIHDVSKEDLNGVDGIIHLAGLSNDSLAVFIRQSIKICMYFLYLRFTTLKGCD
jgi:nucleoside-diphosphate-sugar epimerase